MPSSSSSSSSAAPPSSVGGSAESVPKRSTPQPAPTRRAAPLKDGRAVDDDA